MGIESEQKNLPQNMIYQFSFILGISYLFRESYPHHQTNYVSTLIVSKIQVVIVKQLI